MNLNEILQSNHSYPIYDWINHEFLTQVLKSYTNRFISIKKYKNTYATKRGENYSSALFRSLINYLVDSTPGTFDLQCNNEISVIIKAKLYYPNIERGNDYLDYMFLREYHVYKIILKEFEKIIGNYAVFAPKLLYADDRSIVQEDLQNRGYYIKAIKNRLNYNECQLVIKKIAKFHAVSAILYSEKPKLFKHHLRGNITEKISPFHLIYINSIDSCIRMAKKTSALQKYVKNLEAFGKSIISKMISVYTTTMDDGTFKTLNHGDLWVNNIMFSDEENDVLLVDYQEGYFGSPGIDLNWFFYSSCNQNVLSSHLDELIVEYHCTLVDTLIKFNFTGNVPTITDIWTDINKTIDHGIATLCCIAPLLAIENIEYADTEMVVSMDEKYVKIRDIVFSNPHYQNLLILNLPKFIENGQL